MIQLHNPLTKFQIYGIVNLYPWKYVRLSKSKQQAVY